MCLKVDFEIFLGTLFRKVYFHEKRFLELFDLELFFLKRNNFSEF